MKAFFASPLPERDRLPAMAWRPRLRTRLLAAYLLPTTLAMVLIAGAAYGIAWRALEQSLGERLANVAQGVAVGLRPDDALFLSSGDEESRTYRRVRQRLEQHREATGVRRVLLFDPSGRAIVDSEGGYAIGARISDLSRDSLEVERCLAGQAGASTVTFVGSDGLRYMTGYAPLFDESGKVVAAVAVDGSAAFFEALSALGRGLGILGLLGLVSVVAVSIFISRSITSPITDLAFAARRIGGGDLGTPVQAGSREDEIGQLAGSLEAMRAQLEARQRELQMMLAGIAHEVRNPLGGIELFTGLLEEDLAGDEEKLSHVARIRRELAYLGRLVKEFLDYARERPLELGPVSVEAVLTEVADLVSAEAKGRGVGVEVACAADGGRMQILADGGVLRRALLNLARNAVQAVPEEGRVVLSASREEGRMVFSVSDDGPGVPEELRSRIFEPFFTTREKGSGLGLALVRKAAEAHGGSATAGTSEQGGARFEIRLPAA
jgi:signal transduction histidine kinase